MSCTVMFVKIFFQKSARKSSTTVMGMSSAFTISSTSSSSRFPGISRMTAGGSPFALSRSFSATRLALDLLSVRA